MGQTGRRQVDCSRVVGQQQQMAYDTVHCTIVGKSTLVERLAEKLSACRLQSPPEEIRHLRAAFDSKAGVARRAFYYFGNYLLAHRVRQIAKRQTVVLDR